MRVDEDGQFWMLIGAVAGAIVGAAAGAIISYATTGKVNWWAVAGGAAAGALIGCGAGYLADKAVMASSWAAAASAGGTSAAAVGRNFENWFYKFVNVAKSMQQVAVKGIGRLDAISKGKIIELKNYDWSKYKYLNSVIKDFKAQGLQYKQLIGQKIKGEVIN